MPTKTITLELDAYEKLRRSKQKGESFSAVVRRARFDPVNTRGSTFLGCLEAMVARESDQKAMIHFEKDALSERTISQSVWNDEGAP